MTGSRNPRRVPIASCVPKRLSELAWNDVPRSESFPTPYLDKSTPATNTAMVPTPTSTIIRSERVPAQNNPAMSAAPADIHRSQPPNACIGNPVPNDLYVTQARKTPRSAATGARPARLRPVDGQCNPRNVIQPTKPRQRDAVRSVWVTAGMSPIR